LNLITPSIPAESVEELQTKINDVAKCAERINVDVIDGLFADNLTVMPADFELIDWQGLQADVHLMTVEPIEYLRDLQVATVDRVFGHIERMSNRAEFLSECKEAVIRPGLAVDLFTPMMELADEDLAESDGILLLAVKAGFSGQEFNPLVYEKIKDLRKRGYEKDIVIDGGVGPGNLKMLVEAGANVFAITSSLWQTEKVCQRYAELKELVA
jgi:ribulose-phosphate 3-epimerase